MKRNSSVAVLGIFFATAGRAGDVEPEPVLRMGVVGEAYGMPPLILRADLTSPPMTKDEMAAKAGPREQMGSGGDVGGLALIQSLFSNATSGNKVDLFWDETSENPSGVEAFLDGALLGKAPGLPAGQLPGLNRANITKVSMGPHTFKVQAEGTASEATLTVLDLKPFSEPVGLQCKSMSDFLSPETGLCGMEVSWTLSGPEPEFINIWIDRIFQSDFPGGQRSVFFTDVPPGNYEVMIRGFLPETLTALYGGDFLISTCDIACEDLPCNSVSNLETCQIHYGAEPPGNQVQIEWVNGETAYTGGVNAYLDGVLSVSGGPTSNLGTIGNLTAGDRKIGIEGDCGPDGKAAIREAIFPVKDQTPHPNPITGGLTCKYDAANTSTEVTWTPADPSGGVLVFVTSEGQTRQYIGKASPSTPSITINGTAETDAIGVIFFKFVDGNCYGSELFSCTPGASGLQYIQGICHGEGAVPAITSAIFGLNWLFFGGPTPPCKKACDSDGSGTVNITDMVYVLNYLFLGGTPPTLWGGPNPVCSTAGPEDDCEIPNPACPI